MTGANPAAGACPGCGRRGQLRYQWRPDFEPTQERIRCYRCGEDSGWQPIGTFTPKGAS